MDYNTPESVIGLSEDDLLLIVGRQILPPGFAVDDRDTPTKKKDGENWFIRLMRNKRFSVCQQPKVRAYVLKEATYDQVVLLSAVADTLSGATRGVSPFVASALFLHYGLERLCMSQYE